MNKRTKEQKNKRTKEFKFYYKCCELGFFQKIFIKNIIRYINKINLFYYHYHYQYHYQNNYHQTYFY